jgi:hypothetical protein
MTDQDLTPLDLATQERCREVRRRAEGAIRQLDPRGMPINFASVASAATVSRSWLYRDANIRASIERLRRGRRSQPIPATQRLQPTPYGVSERPCSTKSLASRTRTNNCGPKSRKCSVIDGAHAHDPVNYMSPARQRRLMINSDERLQITVNNLIKRVKRAAFGFRHFRNYRVRALLYAGKPDWSLLRTIHPMG